MVNRKKPMKILVAGMPRTGTVSITSALKELGFTPYDYFTRLEEGHLAHWNAMLKAKCRGQLRGLDKDSVDRLTGDFDVCCKVNLHSLYPTTIGICRWTALANGNVTSV